MCCRLSNSHHCLNFLSVLGFLQALIGVPITVLSVLVLVQGGLGYLLSPFWCGALLLIAGAVGLCIRPSRLAVIIGFHLILNVCAVLTCAGAGAISGIYGVSVILPGYDSIYITGGRSDNVTLSNSTVAVNCIFSAGSPLYSNEIQTALQPLDTFVPTCFQLETFWTHLVANMSLCFIGCLISIVAAITNCATPCVEDRYHRKWSPNQEDV